MGSLSNAGDEDGNENGEKAPRKASNTFVRASPFFVRFFSVLARPRPEIAQFLRFVEDVNTGKRFPSLFWSLIQPLVFNLRKNSPIFDRLNDEE